MKPCQSDDQKQRRARFVALLLLVFLFRLVSVCSIRLISKDGCGWFIPMARSGMQGDWDAVFAWDQHPLFPIYM